MKEDAQAVDHDGEGESHLAGDQQEPGAIVEKGAENRSKLHELLLPIES
jgi:hypothetical protein